MTQRTLLGVLFAAGLLCVGGTAEADSLRCKSGKIISSGDSLYEVVSACGEPDFVRRYVRYQTVYHRVPAACAGASRRSNASSAYGCYTYLQETVPVVVDEWTYDFGRNRFVELVVFEQGFLQSVSTLGYSHGN